MHVRGLKVAGLWHTMNTRLHVYMCTYIYIYMCVCVCVLGGLHEDLYSVRIARTGSRESCITSESYRTWRDTWQLEIYGCVCMCIHTHASDQQIGRWKGRQTDRPPDAQTDRQIGR